MVLVLLTTVSVISIAPVAAETRHPSWPGIMDYLHNQTKLTSHIIDLAGMFLNSIRLSENSTTIYQYMLGFSYWGNLKGEQSLRALTVEDDTNITDLYGGPKGLRTETNQTFNDIVGYIPDLLGPPNGTTGMGYLLNHSARKNATLVRDQMNDTLGFFRNTMPMVGDMVSELPNVFGYVDKASRPIW